MENIKPTINVTQLYISNQKMLYNIMVTNTLLAVSLGVQLDDIKNACFDLDAITDLGISGVPDLMDPLKC